MKSRIIALIVLLLFTISGCSFLGNKITEIKIEGDDFIEVNESKLLEVSFDKKGVKAEVEFTSSDEGVLIVEEDGYITGISAGVATIRVSLKEDESIFATLEITVTEAELESIRILGPFDIFVDSTTQLNISSTPQHASKDVTWESSNNNIATVGETGLVTALSIGEVEISAASIIDPTKVATITMNVKQGAGENFKIVGPKAVDIDSEIQFSALSGGVDITSHFNWETSNAEIATITENGILTALTVGEVVITATNINDPEISKTYTISVIVPEFEYVASRVLAIDRTKNYIELLNVSSTKLDANTRLLKYDGNNVTTGSLDDIYVGMENVYVEYSKNSDSVKAILIDQETGYSNIRVGIRKNINDISDDSTRFHDSIDFVTYEPITIQTFDGNDEVRVNQSNNLRFKVESGKIVITNNGITIMETTKRLIIIPDNDSEAIRIDSISRGSNRTYSGNMEVSLYLGRMLVVNDISLEKYLYKVVPSEMPASYHMEALKAQAIAARTYAYKDILNRTFEKYGYTVDDSVMSQVYNNQNQQTNTTAAVNATKGLIMMHDGELVNAFYYSTSAGITASAHEVWISDDNLNPAVIDYLIGQNHTTDQSGNTIEFDYTNEVNMLNFFKTINVSTPDSTIGFHRWKVSFTKSQLTQTISKNLTLRYAQNPNLILTKVGDTYKSLPITTSIGQVENIYVGKRGTSGVVIELIVETTTNTYKIINQYNMRFTLRPQDANTSNYTSTATSANYSKSSSNSILFSGFFAIEEVNGTFTFYGGGNGHGVGMSQNGANSLGKSGKNYIEILNSYYSSIDLIDITYEYKELPFFRDYFLL